MKKVYFVGVHNKKGMQPLDSSTISGKRIDEIISQLPFESVKTNVNPVEYLPKCKNELKENARNWHQRFSLNTDDIIVLLGAKVQKQFIKTSNKTIEIKHPSVVMNKNNLNNYIQNTVKWILSN